MDQSLMAMATTATPPSPLSTITQNRLSLYAHNHVSNFPSLRQSHHGYSKLMICHAKFSSAFDEEANDFDDSLFNGFGELVEDESDDEDDTESSIDLLLRFLGSMFKKVSKRARRASRSILPDVIPPQLVSFAVDGVLFLASLSILKALLEVVCNLGGAVFASVLLLRVIWFAVSYFQPNGNGFDQSGASYGRPQPVQ